MDPAMTFIILLGCCVWTRGQSVSFSMVFSAGIQLLVHTGEQTADRDDIHHQNKTNGSSSSSSSVRPTAQILTLVPVSQDPGSPHLLVCVLSELKSPLQDVLWWVDDTVVTTSGADVSVMRSEEEGGAYSAISVWEVAAAEWRSSSTYWCGTIQEGQVYREKLCSQD